MAYYKYSKFFSEHKSNAFDSLQPPGKTAENAGIYRCTGCGHEIGIAKNHTLPPQGHHAHPNPLVPIQWQLVACAAN